MSDLDPIPTTAHARAGCAGAPREFGNAPAILNEVRHALQRLVSTGEEARIDLSALPFGPGDLERLEALLGSGEVAATVDAMGLTHVRETAVPGVWLVDYRNSENQRLTLHLEIARVPEILRPQPQDLAEAVGVLDARLQSREGSAPVSS